MLTLINILIVALGIGMLIFVHELGHFLVAKKVGMRVEAFSLGFGPRLWGFVRGETDYKICAIPLGGYVKIAGMDPGEATGAENEYLSKTISQRAWVVSAGVIMNVIFAFILFPLAFSIGVPFDAPVVGGVSAGGPAWQADLREGDRIVSINDTPALGFTDVRTEIAFSDEAHFVLERDGETIERIVRPVYDEGIGFKISGILYQPSSLRAKKGSDLLDDKLERTDTIVAINDIPARDVLDRADEIHDESVKSLALTVRDENGDERIVELPSRFGPWTKKDRYFRLGIRRWDTRVDRYLRSDDNGRTLASLPERLGMKNDDIIIAVGQAMTRTSDAFEKALRKLEDDDAATKETTITVLRRDAAGVENEVTLASLTIRPGTTDDIIRSLVFEPYGLRFDVEDESPAHTAGMQSGDELVRIGDEEIVSTSDAVRTDEENDDAWVTFVKTIRKSGGDACQVVVMRDGVALDFEVAPFERRRNLVMDELELQAERVYQRIPFPSSVAAGFRQTLNQGKNILLTLKSLLSGDVAAKNLGGIILIARASYTFAEEGMGKILFFMAILSLNLAVLNILPIPVLDGGHLFFLAIEKIKGGPVSDRVMGYANWVGLVFILALMAFVTFNDIRRLVS